MIEVRRTRYVTEFRERETGNELWRSGRFIGTYVVPEGERPFKDREAYYDIVEVHDLGSKQDGIDAVFEAAGVDENEFE